MTVTRLRDRFLATEFDGVLPRPKLLQQLLGRRLKKPLIDEQLWTLVFASGFCKEPAELYRVLTEGAAPPAGCRAWLEMLPLPPRRGTKKGESEGNSNIDLVLGSIGKRGTSASGVQFDPRLGDGICLVEAKWLSDISYRTTHDHHRNQLLRVIECAATMQHHEARAGEQEYTPQSAERFPRNVHVTMLTPAVFRRSGIQSRLYAYKFHEYRNDVAAIVRDLELSVIDRRGSTADWEYPDMASRLPQVHLHWVTHEEVFRAMPKGKEKDNIREFVEIYGDWRVLDKSTFTKGTDE